MMKKTDIPALIDDSANLHSDCILKNLFDDGNFTYSSQDTRCVGYIDGVPCEITWHYNDNIMVINPLKNIKGYEAREHFISTLHDRCEQLEVYAQFDFDLADNVYLDFYWYES